MFKFLELFGHTLSEAAETNTSTLKLKHKETPNCRKGGWMLDETGADAMIKVQ